jgi:hypothetical protein
LAFSLFKKIQSAANPKRSFPAHSFSRRVQTEDEETQSVDSGNAAADR